jgi:hypothetical protein
VLPLSVEKRTQRTKLSLSTGKSDVPMDKIPPKRHSNGQERLLFFFCFVFVILFCFVNGIPTAKSACLCAAFIFPGI